MSHSNLATPTSAVVVLTPLMLPHALEPSWWARARVSSGWACSSALFWD